MSKFFQSFFSSGRQNDFSTVLSKRSGGFFSDSGRSTGDDNDFVFNIFITLAPFASE
jgi:hypothetical protein